jgi:hypothetical protein
MRLVECVIMSGFGDRRFAWYECIPASGRTAYRTPSGRSEVNALLFVPLPDSDIA